MTTPEFSRPVRIDQLARHAQQITIIADAAEREALARRFQLVALLATGRFALALAGMDVGTSFGGIGSSREMLIASGSTGRASGKNQSAASISSGLGWILPPA